MIREAFRASAVALALFVAPVVSHCGGVDDQRLPELEPETGRVFTVAVELIDEGDVCLYADAAPETFFERGAPQVFEAGSRLAVTVAAPECLSQSCDVHRVAHCSVDREGATLVVSSELRYDELQAKQCTLDCGRLAARCESEPLEEGTYEVVHGEASIALTVPSTIEPCVYEPTRHAE